MRPNMAVPTKQSFPCTTSWFNKAQINEMKTPALTSLIVALAAICLTTSAQTTSEMPNVVEPGATVQKLSGEFAFTEGPS